MQGCWPPASLKRSLWSPACTSCWSSRTPSLAPSRLGATNLLKRFDLVIQDGCRLVAVTASAQREADVLYLRVLKNGVYAALLAQAGLLEAAKRSVDRDLDWVVDRDVADLKGVAHAQGAGTVARADHARQAVAAVVGDAHGVGLVAERNHHLHRTENFVLRNLHAVTALGEQGGGDEIAIAQLGASRQVLQHFRVGLFVAA